MANYKRYKRKEAKMMKSRGLIPTPNSGALWGWKGDGQDETWMVEYKFTSSKQYILKLETWKKVEKESLRTMKRPRMEIDFDGKILVVLSQEDFDELFQKEV